MKIQDFSTEKLKRYLEISRRIARQSAYAQLVDAQVKKELERRGEK